MFAPEQYRAKAARYTQLLKTTTSPAEARDFRELEQSYITLAENDEWLAENLEITHGQTAPENLYGDVILAQHKQLSLPTKIQQLFDDAWMGGAWCKQQG
jgi:hypothetical protein